MFCTIPFPYLFEFNLILILKIILSEMSLNSACELQKMQMGFSEQLLKSYFEMSVRVEGLSNIHHVSCANKFII